MSAEDALGKQFTLYHGSPMDFPDGHTLLPGHETRQSFSSHVWMSTDPHEAAEYGHVYEVHAENPEARPVQGRYTAKRATVVRRLEK